MANLRSVILALLFFLLCDVVSMAQPTTGSIAVEQEDETSSQIIQQLAVAKPDTNSINLLIKLSHVYWRKKNGTNHLLDSSYVAAVKARDLSNKLHFIKGSNEANFMLCRITIEKDDTQGAMKIASKVYGEERVRLLIIIAEHFTFSRGSPAQIDKAYPILIDAINTGNSIGSPSWYYQSLLLLGKYYFIKGDFSRGKNAVLQIIRSCEKRSDFAGEAHYWSELGTYMPKTDSASRYIVYCHAMAVKYYLKAGNKKEAAYSLKDKAWADMIAEQPDSAEKDGLEVFSMLRAIKVKPSFHSYTQMADIYQLKGDFPNALKYTIAALNLYSPLNQYDKPYIDNELAIIYDELGQPEKALIYIKASFNYALSDNNTEMYYWKYRQIKDQIKTGDVKSALSQMIAFTKKNKPTKANDKELVSAGYAELYFALRDFKKAESYYLEMIEHDKEAMLDSKTALRLENDITGSEAFAMIGRFYLERKQYALAEKYLHNALTGPQTSNVEDRSNIELLAFKADSALGKFVSAIRYFEHSKNLRDSMFNATKSRQISELEIQYKTDQREKSFLALKNKNMLQNEELEREHLQRNITFAGTAALLVIAGLAYNGYRNKKRSNLKLTKQQVEINIQNHQLQNLVADKDKLLTEKDWLLKEVHHRVKNNLQIVMSLLSSQSAYLENTAALDAIQESQNRVQAISLIHQKLYSSNNVAHISMPAYVADLVGYLADCFDTRSRGIRIEQLIESFNLDLAQAVPLGLILNEAITNAIKYAFDKKGGEIIIAIQQVGDDGLILHISDNGKGLPDDFDLNKANSLGMEMMKALSKQLGGEFKIRNQSGLHISVEFIIERVYNQVTKEGVS